MQVDIGRERTGRFAVMSRLLTDALRSATGAGTAATAVLDCGGGSGTFAVPLAALGADVTVVDISADALATATRRASEAGVGHLVRPIQGDASWWHGGTLPGTTSMLVRTYHNFSLVGLFNTRSLTANLEAELHAALWNALAGVTSFPAHDLFSTFR